MLLRQILIINATTTAAGDAAAAWWYSYHSYCSYTPADTAAAPYQYRLSVLLLLLQLLMPPTAAANTCTVADTATAVHCYIVAVDTAAVVHSSAYIATMTYFMSIAS